MQNNEAIKNRKTELRQLVLKRRNALTREQVASFSSKICESLSSQFLTNPKLDASCRDLKMKSDLNSGGFSHLTIAVYDAMKGEVDLSEFVNSAKVFDINVCKPFIVNDEKGHMEFTSYDAQFSQLDKFSIDDFEVVAPEAIDLIVCPVVAFDNMLNRLGYGGGFYDRYLRRLPSYVPKIGVAFEVQKVNDVPIDKNDLKLDYFVTEDFLTN